MRRRLRGFGRNDGAEIKVLLGKSLFESVLDRLKQDDEERQDDAPSVAQPRGFGGGLVGAVFENTPQENGCIAHPYFEALDGVEAPPPPEPRIPAHLLRLTLEEIAADLAIAPQDTMQDLQEKRRRFARSNHPDGIAEPFRDKANIRMTIANRLIDDALRRLAPLA